MWGTYPIRGRLLHSLHEGGLGEEVMVHHVREVNHIPDTFVCKQLHYTASLK